MLDDYTNPVINYYIWHDHHHYYMTTLSPYNNSDDGASKRWTIINKPHDPVDHMLQLQAYHYN
jgi:hypothetical protein